MVGYNFREIEKKWQEIWHKKQIFKVSNQSGKPKYYVMDMFPYPSGAGLHVGHQLGYIASDIVARFKRLKGYNVLHPMGFDSFGLPAEQYAIQTGQHPAVTTEKNIAMYKKQLRALGFSYDWSREIRTSDPSFYKWTQWTFKLIYNSWYNQRADKAEEIRTLVEKLEKEGNQTIRVACDADTPLITAKQWKSFNEREKELFLLKYRLAYKADTMVNWCPALGTVLSNDEVKDGFSERGGHPVVKKPMPQWNIRITAYADRLLSGLDKIDWPEPIKEMQRNWIGKSYGAEIGFRVHEKDEKIRVFTTRMDTIYGVTFMVLAPEHELVHNSLITPDQKKAVNKYLETTKNKSERDRMSNVKNVTGVFTGSYAIHPFTGKKIPIWIADYVLAGYGTGAVMAVPSGDQRDFDFAKHFGLPIVKINDAQQVTNTHADPTKKGKIINSGFLNGLVPAEAIEKGIEEIEKKDIGKRKVNYKLRHAIFGRQRYWGEPIPVYYEEDIPRLVEDGQLPLILPKVNEYLPTEEGDPPLGRSTNWTYKGHPYELSTMPGWAGSSWYFFRYMDPQNKTAFCSKEALDYWQEVDIYIGGSEHATGHLFYSRFWTKFLYDMGIIKVDEYAKKLVNQGMIQGTSQKIQLQRGNKKTYKVADGTVSSREAFACFYSNDMDIDPNASETTEIHVDIHHVKNGELNIEKFIASRKDFKNALFISKTGYHRLGETVKHRNDIPFKFYTKPEIEKMSKSKFNVVTPDDLIEKYGADTLRMYEIFLGPIEQSKPWNTNGIEGVAKFLRKFWGLSHKADQFFVSDEYPSKEELKILHSTIKKIAQDVENLSLNTSVSTFMISVNKLAILNCNKRSVIEPLTIVLSPFAPHMAEELWSLLGHDKSVTYASYPSYKEEYLIEDTIEYPVTVNGKMRTKMTFPSVAPKEQIEEKVLSHDIIKKWTGNKTPKKIIIIPGKIVNIVV